MLGLRKVILLLMMTKFAAPVPLRKTVVLFGDSITQYAFGENGEVGWASLLSSSYQRRADVLNRGFSGYNTRHALDLLDTVFGPPNGHGETGGTPLFVTVFFGANDAVLEGERQHVPLKEYGENLKALISGIRERIGRQVPLIVLTPPPIEKDAWKAFLELDYYPRTNEHSRLYGQLAQKIALENGCHVLDTWTLLGGDKSEAEFSPNLCDGLHLSAAGNKLVYEALMNLLVSKIPDAAPMVDGEGRYGEVGIPMEEKLWGELC